MIDLVLLFDASSCRGLYLDIRTTGPLYTIECRDGMAFPLILVLLCSNLLGTFYNAHLLTLAFCTISCFEHDILPVDRSGSLLGTTSGFTIPFTKLMHCDTMQVFARSD